MHPNMKGPQRSNAVLKAALTTHSSKVEQHLHNSAHWHHWRHAWAWGVYAYLPTNASNMVVGVPSGNTLSVTSAAGGTQRVRLAGVGAPVVGQAFFSESQGNLEALANGQHVRVFPVGTDVDGAVVAQVFLDSGLYLNERQIQSGMAWNAVDDGFDPSLAGAEEVAQSGGAGMWGGDYSAAY
ncbi:MAG TPA: thermonuclease family protein [Planctomycetaceae bacterium]|nr:thermonuclease family protein [Planctomycetaceae bacterium]